MKAKFSLGDKVRVVPEDGDTSLFDFVVGQVIQQNVKTVEGDTDYATGTSESYVVNTPTYFYSDGEPGSKVYKESSLEKVIPKKTFYLWVADGHIHGQLLDSERVNTKGKKISLSEPCTMIPNTGVDLPYSFGMPQGKYSSKKKVQEDDDHGDIDED
jgi:hypothetical protein